MPCTHCLLIIVLHSLFNLLDFLNSILFNFSDILKKFLLFDWLKVILYILNLNLSFIVFSFKNRNKNIFFFIIMIMTMIMVNVH